MQPHINQLLHTDILKRLYSQVTVAVESQSDNVRKSHLLDELGISRTYAITHFHPLNWTDKVAQIAAEIRQGKSIGETFQRHGYNIHKKPVCAIKVGLSKQLRERMATTRAIGALYQYVLSVAKGTDSPLYFATITEVYPADLSEVLERERILVITPHATPQYSGDFENEIIL